MELSVHLPLLLLLLLLPSSIPPSSADNFTVSSHPAKLVLPPGRPVDGASKASSVMSCNRVHIHGSPRFRHLDKYANSLKVRANFAAEDSGLRTPSFEVCFHRNASVPVGMCPAGAWEKVSKGLWVQSMSPYDVKILDVRLPRSASSRLIEVSTEEEFLFHRVVFLVVGMVMMLMARWLSQSVVFYYGSAMAVGILLVILMVLFQGMKLLPTGRKSSFAIFMYSSVIGVASFLLRYLSGLLRSLLVEIGISEDMHNPVCKKWSVLIQHGNGHLEEIPEIGRETPMHLFMLLICCLILVGAWLGFWSVRKLVLVEDGSVDEGIAYFVEWAILIFAAAMIVESSLDSLLAVEALILSVVLSMITRKTRKLKFLRRLYRKITRYVHSTSQYSPSMYANSEYHYPSPKAEKRSLKYQARPCAMSPFNQHAKGLAKTPSKKLLADDMYYSTFHKTPDRKKYTKEEWKDFTRDTTRQAMEELCSSPDFGRWAAASADRISVTPVTGSSNSDKVRRRFYWF